MRKQAILSGVAVLALIVLTQVAAAQSLTKWIPKLRPASQTSSQLPSASTDPATPAVPVPEPVESVAPGTSDYGVPGGSMGNATPYEPSADGEMMSPWPGVPACCDPWLGYCHEPRCYPCAKGRGHYTYYEPGRDGCGGRFITYGPDCRERDAANSRGCRLLGWGVSKKCAPSNGCVTCGDCERLPECASCSTVGTPAAGGDSPFNTPSSAPGESAPPRNDLPTNVTARRLR